VFAEVKAYYFIVQGVYANYFKETVKKTVLISDWKRYA
jgi:hypothetical protein